MTEQNSGMPVDVQKMLATLRSVLTEHGQSH